MAASIYDLIVIVEPSNFDLDAEHYRFLLLTKGLLEKGVGNEKIKRRGTIGQR